jgi:PKD repeat protein
VLHVQVADNGSVYAAGDTDSPLFPVTNGSYQTVHEGLTDSFILRLSANGSVMEFGTFVGGKDREYCEGLFVDPAGRAVLVGSTYSIDFPTKAGVQQQLGAGKFDMFLFRLTSDGTESLYSTYLGGTEWDLAYGVDVDADGDAYIAGASDSINFPTTSGAYQRTNGGRVDMLLSKLDMYLDIEPPVSKPGTDMIVDQHTTVTFNGSSSTDNVGVVNWSWEFEYNGSTMLFWGPRFMWKFDLAGKYYVYLTVRDAVDLSDREWVSVFVNDTEPPIAEAPNDMSAQQHWTITLDGGGSHDNVMVVRWTWTVEHDDNVQTLSGKKVDYIVDDAGVYVITLTVEDANGNWDADQFIVTVFDITPPVLVLEFDEIAVDQFDFVRFNATGSSDNVAITNFTWSFYYAGAPIELYGPSPSFKFDRAGLYDVSVTVTDEVGNRNFGKVKINVKDTTDPVARAGPDVTIDQNQVVELDGSGSSDNVGITNWRWTITIGDSTSDFPGQKNAFTFIAAGVFGVGLNVSDAAGNWATDSFQVTVRDVTPPTAAAGESVVVAQDDLVVFDGTGSTDNVGITTWNWEILVGGKSVSLSGPTPNYTFVDVGAYRVTLKVFDAAGLSDSDDMQVTVLDTQPPVADAGPSIKIDLDGKAYFDGTNSSDNIRIVSWEWTFNYNQAEVKLEGTKPAYTFELQGLYVVTLTVTDESGNTATDTTVVEVLSDFRDDDGDGITSGGLGGLLLWIILIVVVVAVVSAVLFVRSRRGGDEGDLGWAPTEEEIKARDTSNIEEGNGNKKGVDGDDEGGAKGVRKGL